MGVIYGKFTYCCWVLIVYYFYNFDCFSSTSNFVSSLDLHHPICLRNQSQNHGPQIIYVNILIYLFSGILRMHLSPAHTLKFKVDIHTSYWQWRRRRKRGIRNLRKMLKKNHTGKVPIRVEKAESWKNLKICNSKAH